eukprot:gene23348-biopygen2831
MNLPAQGMGKLCTGVKLPSRRSGQKQLLLSEEEHTVGRAAAPPRTTRADVRPAHIGVLGRERSWVRAASSEATASVPVFAPALSLLGCTHGELAQ